MTTSNLTFYDAAFPPSTPPAGMDGVAFYIGGDTPHVWTLAEIEAANVRFRLPIFVRSDPQQANASVDVEVALARLAAIGAPKGTLVALDSETSVDVNYVAQFYYGIKNGGYVLIDYGSVSSVFGNNIPDGYYWGAHWTNRPGVEPGTQMTQWESLNSYDESSALPTLPFWDTRIPVNPPAPTPSPATNWTENAVQELPELSESASGPMVARLQGLLVADGFEMGTSGVRRDGIDGEFGPITLGAVRTFQQNHGLTPDGIVGPLTWPKLLGV